MFTGIIREMGQIVAHQTTDQGHVVDIATSFTADLREGESVAVNGTCLTVLSASTNSWQIRLMQETLAKTNLGQLKVGDHINVERSLRTDQHLDGHFVLGHIDGTCTIVDIQTIANDSIFTFEVPLPLMRYIVPKGSVALDGVSLTVVDVQDTTFTVSIMPYTMRLTTFGTRQIGDTINLEVDIIGKYVERLTAYSRS